MTTAVAEKPDLKIADASDETGEDLLAGIDLGEGVTVEDGEAPETNSETNGATDGTISPDGETASTETLSEVALGETVAAIESLPTDPPDLTPAEIQELKQQLVRLQTIVEDLRHADTDIVAQAARVRELADEVQSCESAAKEAKAEHTAAKERLETARRDLQSMIADRAKGQRRLRLQETAVVTTAPGQTPETTTAVTHPAAVVETVVGLVPVVGETAISSTESAASGSTTSPATDEHADSPISVLSSKTMLATFGQGAWQAAKDKDEPFGLGKAELETLEAAEITTIGELEKRMREDAWWHKKLPKFGEKKVAKLIESLRVWRGKFPMPERA